MTRREWMALSALLISSGCGPKRGTGYAGYALIATSGDDSLGVVDLNAFRVLDPIPLGARPTAVVPGNPATHSYILTPETGSVHVLDGTLRVARSQKLGEELSEIRITPDGGRLLAISATGRELIEADSSSLKVLRRHKLAGEPVSLDVAQGSLAAVSTGEAGIVQLFDLTRGRYGQAGMSGPIGAVRFRADGQRLLVANLHDWGLTALTVPSLESIAELPLAMQPQNLCFNADAGQLFVSGAGMDGVAIVFPYTPLEVEQTVLAGRDPGVMACSAEPALLFVGSNSGSDVCILSIDTRKVIGFVDVGQQPTYITITPDNQYALLLDRAAGVMAVIRIPAISVDPSIVRRVERPPAALFTMLQVGDQPVHAAVVPFA